MAPSSGINDMYSAISERSTVSVSVSQDKFTSTFSNIVLRTGEHSWGRFYRVIASQGTYLFMVISFIPARMLLLRAYNLVRFHGVTP